MNCGNHRHRVNTRRHAADQIHLALVALFRGSVESFNGFGHERRVRWFITGGAVDDRSLPFNGLQMRPRRLPVPHGFFGQLERLSLFGALARLTLATGPGEDDDANAAEQEDAATERDQYGPATARRRGRADSLSTGSAGRGRQRGAESHRATKNCHRRQCAASQSTWGIPCRAHQCPFAIEFATQWQERYIVCRVRT